MKRAVAYLRVSTKGQVGEDKFGIEAQRDMILEYCQKNEIEIADWFVDEAVSGADIKRPALGRLLSGEVENPPVNFVIVAKADRLSRDVTLYHSIKYKLKEFGLEIISVKEDWSAQDKLAAMILENFMAMFADIERESIKSRMIGGRRVKANQGGYAGGQPPMGYRVEGKRLVINEDEAPTVRFIFQKKSEGATMQATVNALNEAGYKTRRGKPFVTSTVQSIWKNEPTYRGMYRYGENGEWVQGVHEPILKE